MAPSLMGSPLPTKRRSPSLDSSWVWRDVSYAMDILDVLFPARCTECGRFGSVLCLQCFPHAPPLRRSLDGFQVIALGAYDGPLRRAVLAMKSGRRDILRAFAIRLSSLVTSDEIFVGVPTIRTRRFHRGFDCGVFLASIVASRTSTHMQRLLDARGIPQHGRSGVARRLATGRFSLRYSEKRSLRITLIDDVCTTGATMLECARLLMQAQHTVVRALTVALVP